MLETVARAVFEVCGDKSLGTKQCVEQLVNRLGIVPTNQEFVEKAIRDYRLSGKSLSNTAEAVVKAITGCDTCSPCDNCRSCDPGGSGIRFEEARNYFADRGFISPGTAATFVTQYLSQTIRWDEGEKLELDKVEEVSEQTFSYDGLAYSCYNMERLRDLTVQKREEEIMDYAYDMALDEVRYLSNEEVAECYSKGFASDIKVIEDFGRDPIVVIALK